jgi:hypothetical protein
MKPSIAMHACAVSGLETVGGGTLMSTKNYLPVAGQGAVSAVRWTRGRYVVLGVTVSVVAVLVAVVVIVVQNRITGEEQRVEDAVAGLSYAMPDGWRASGEMTGFGQTSAIETGVGFGGDDQPTGLNQPTAVAVAGRWDSLFGETPPDDQLALAAVQLAEVYGMVLLGPLLWNPQELSRYPVEIDGHAAGAASFRVAYSVGDISSGYMKVTVVRVDNGPLSFVIAFGMPEDVYGDELESIHAGIGIVG